MQRTIGCITLTEWLLLFIYANCFYYLCVYPMQTANLNAIKALGRSDLFLKLEVIKKSMA